MSPNLVLIGFMGSGKSTIGRRCAAALAFRFRDSDFVVERAAGMSVRAVFAERGEAAFRALESEAVRRLASTLGLVIATGGGAAMDAANAACLRRTGVVVHLRVAPAEVVARVGSARTRPLLSGVADPRARVEELMAARGPRYEAAADATVDGTGLLPEETTRRVLAAYRAAAVAWTWPREPVPVTAGDGTP
ncbi:MAG: shikimate kinase [Chthonomonadales bacterium]|nr:shikimate kinase [Chthonomonadales bacterium]